MHFLCYCLGPNPHLGHLALADAFVITADSVSMLSEACTTGYFTSTVIQANFWLILCLSVPDINIFDTLIICLSKPVYVIGAERCTWKFADFQKSLREQGAARPFTGKEDVSQRLSYSAYICATDLCI